MKLDLIRKELDMYDNIIKNMITLRMSLIPIVADIKMKNNLPIFQSIREDEIYINIEKFSNENGVESELITKIYKLIISNAIKIEEQYMKKPENFNINKSIEKDIKEEFEKLDNILLKEIPQIINNIKSFKNLSHLNLTEKSTIYYNDKTT